MRWLPDIIEKILEKVPTSYESLRNKLSATKRSSEFAAPEMQGLWWGKCSDILTNEIGFPKEDWQWKEEPANKALNADF